MLEKTKEAIRNRLSRNTGKHWAHKTHDEDKQNKTQKTKMMSNTDPPKTGG